MRKKIFISVALWGNEYATRFIDYNLSTQLSEGNIPGIASFCDVTYQIITTRDDKQWMETQALIKKLGAFCAIQWDFIEEIFGESPLAGGFVGDKYSFLSMLQNLAMKNAAGSDILVFNYADFVWADGSIRNLINDFGENTDAVLSFCMRVDEEQATRAFRKYADDHGIIQVSPREAVDIALTYPHRETKLGFWDDETFTVTPTAILWPVEGEGVVITAYHQTILALRVKPQDILYHNGIITTSLDGYYSAVLAENSRVVHETNSDKIFAVSLCGEMSDSSIQKGYTKDQSIRDCLKRTVSEGQRRFALEPIEIRKTYVHKAKWENVKAQAKEILERYHRETEFDVSLYAKIYGRGLIGSLCAMPAAANQKPSLPLLHIIRNIVVRTLKVLITDLLVPKNIAFNGNFDNWIATEFRYSQGVWVKLSAEYWLGHFDFCTPGRFARTSEVPDKKAKYSLMIEGAQGGTSVYLAQKIDAAALSRILLSGSLTCSGYVRKEGDHDGTISLNVIIPHKKDDFTSYSSAGNIFDQFISIQQSDTWQYFELHCNHIASIENLSNGAMLYFAMSGLNSSDKRIYFSQIQFEAGDTATPFQPRSLLWEGWLQRSINILRLLKHRHDQAARTVNHTLRNKEYLALLHEGEIEILAEKMEPHAAPITFGQEVIASKEAIVCYKIGILPEAALNSISDPDYLRKILEFAEKALRQHVDKAPLSVEGHRALARNLWFQGRVNEAMDQFHRAEGQRITLVKKMGMMKDEVVLLPANCAHVIGLMGHLDAFIKRKILTGDQRPYHMVVSEKEIVNTAFFDYWKPYLNLGFPHMQGIEDSMVNMACTADWNWAIPQEGSRIAHVHGAIARIQRQWQKEARPPLLQLKEQHYQLLERFQSACGMKKDDWFVCLHVRSSGFYNDSSAQDFRNTPIEDYDLLIRSITDAGGWVVRMGDPSMPKLALSGDNNRIIDYAHSSDRSAGLDVALCATCRLFVSSPSGLHTVAHAFGRPVCYVNFPIYAGFPWHPGAIFIPKLYYSIAKHRMLPMKELLSSALVHADHQHLLTKEGIVLLRNTPDEIVETVMEALQGEHYNIENKSVGETARVIFDDLSKKYGLDISGKIGLYFAQKHKDQLFPDECQDARESLRYRYS